MATNMKRKRRFAEGGGVDQEALDKEAGLAESNKEKPVGFFERMRMGNIDDPKSEAYKRFGAGRGAALRASKVPVEDAVPKKVMPTKVADEPVRGGAEDERPAPTGMGAATKFAEKRPAAETKVATVTAKAAPAKAPVAKASTAKVEPVSSGRSAGKGGADIGEVEEYQAKSNRKTGFGSTITNRPEPGAPSIYAGEEEWAKYRAKQKAAKEANTSGSDKASLDNDVNLGYLERRRKQKAAKEASMKNKANGYASGGSVSASRRGDGIATKGKTRGKMC